MKNKLVLVIFFLALNIIQTWAAETATERQQKAADLFLVLDDDEQAEALWLHAPWGLPTQNHTDANEMILICDEYILGYDPELRVPMWAMYRLTKNHLATSITRTEYFREDPRVAAGVSSSPDDYDEPIYDRGHIVPSADMARNINSMLNTYVYTNMSPQHAQFNQKTWRWTEEFVRAWANNREKIFVITGCIFDSDKDGIRDADQKTATIQDKNRVSVPTHFYKILLWVNEDSGYVESMSFVLPHTEEGISKWKTDDYLENECFTNIDTIEKMIGYDLLPAMSKRREAAVERFTAEELWTIPNRK